MKKFIKILFFSLVILLPIKALGVCSIEDKMRYSTLSTNVTASYEYMEKNNSVTFSITINNVHNDLIVKDIINNRTYRSNNKGLNNFTINNLKDGTNYFFEIYAKDNECSYLQFNKIYVNLPKYNKYYQDPVCNDASDHIMCQKWAETDSISYEEFKLNIENYKKKEDIVEIIEPQEKINYYYMISDFWAKYYFYILGGIVVILLPIIIILKKRNNYKF